MSIQVDEVKQHLDQGLGSLREMTTSAFKAVNDRVNVISDRVLALEQSGVSGPGYQGTDEGTIIGGGTGQKFSLQAAICHQAGIKGTDAGHELEVSQELARKLGRKPRPGGIFVPLTALGRPIPLATIVKTAPGTGGSVVPTSYQGSRFIDVLRPASLVLSLGATVIEDLAGSGDCLIPRKTAASTAYWIDADNVADVTESTPTFDQLTLAAKTVGALVGFSHKMLAQSNPAIEQILRKDLTDTLFTEMDKQILQGTGLASEPTGILNSGIGTGTYPGANPDWGDIVGLEADLAVANALLEGGNFAYLVAPDLLQGLKTTDKNDDFNASPAVAGDTGQFIWENGMMNGYKSFPTANLPAGYVLFGNWAELVIGFWGVVEILVNPFSTSGFTKGTVLVRALMDLDAGVRHAASFSEIHGA
ncbi:MAG: phage major capsid protein [Acidobacteriota bacterium]